MAMPDFAKMMSDRRSKAADALEPKKAPKEDLSTEPNEDDLAIPGKPDSKTLQALADGSVELQGDVLVNGKPLPADWVVGVLQDMAQDMLDKGDEGDETAEDTSEEVGSEGYGK